MVSLLRKMLKKVLLHTCAIFLIFTTIAPVIVLHVLNPLSADPTKWSKTLKKTRRQFADESFTQTIRRQFADELFECV